MKLKPEGTWKNSDGSIKMTLITTPGKSDDYSLEINFIICYRLLDVRYFDFIHTLNYQNGIPIYLFNY